MCGICGILNLNGKLVPHDQVVMMNNQMDHRGPDADGIYINKNLGLGHKRLKIIDLEGGIQPMSTIDENVVIVFNGEIYNFREIRNDLEKKGHQFKTHSDTEVILNAYLEYGEKCVDYLRGMFGIAIYDRRNEKIVLFRDRLGIKPLYYYLDNDILVFASEIKPILKALNHSVGINLPSLDFYMSVGYVPGKDTLFDRIKKLEPGHQLICHNNRIEISQYWDLENIPALTISFEDALEEFESLLMDSLSIHTISDVPVGAFLSGGLDSSVIVGLLNKILPDQVKTFSVGYKDQPEANELEYAKIIAKYCNTEHHEYILEPMDFFNSMDVLLDHTEEPIIESAAIALYQLSKLAKEHVTVILSGEGGDEILAGYPLYQIMPKIDSIQSTVKYTPHFFKSGISSIFSGNEKYSKYWDWMCLPLNQRYQGISNDVTSSIKNRMYKSRQILNDISLTSNHYSSLFNKMSNGTDLKKMSYADIKSWLPDDLLVKADKMTMAASLELRVPFLDHKIVEYATNLPDQFRLNGNQGKYLLKKFAENIIPNEIIYRKKKGFPVPIAQWFREELYEKTCEILLDDKSLNRGYFNNGYIENILKRHRNGKEDLSRRIFSLLNLELWHHKYID